MRKIHFVSQMYFTFNYLSFKVYFCSLFWENVKNFTDSSHDYSNIFAWEKTFFASSMTFIYAFKKGKGVLSCQSNVITAKQTLSIP